MSKRKQFKINPSLTNGITQIMHAASEHSGTMRYEAIPLDQLKLDIENPRELRINIEDIRQGLKNIDSDFQVKKKELDDLQSLSNSIKVSSSIYS